MCSILFQWHNLWTQGVALSVSAAYIIAGKENVAEREAGVGLLNLENQI